jgi:glycosyltransferase involved in cell wall biosynthesis
VNGNDCAHKAAAVREALRSRQCEGREVMRIAQVAPLYESVPPKFYGGTERVVSYLTDELIRQGHEVTLFASADSVTNAELRPICQKALRLQGRNIVDPLAHHVRMLEIVAREAGDFDVVHFHIDYLHFPVTRRQNIASVTTLHGRLDIPEIHALFREFPEMNLVSISDAQRQPMRWANWVGTVHHGLPDNLYAPTYKPGKYLAFLGRISPEKRVDRAIEIAKLVGLPIKIAAKIDRVDKDYFESNIRKLLDHPLVEYVGEIGEHEKAEFLGNAYALMFLIDWQEPFGLVMTEAMACGTPVIAYRRGSVPEIIEDGVNGCIVDSMEAAAKSVGRIDSLDRRTVRRVFEERFSARRMCQSYVDIYRRISGGEPNLTAGDLLSSAA